MANKKYLAILQKGAWEWNQWRWRNRDIKVPDLSGADLKGAQLARVDLTAVDLFNANLSDADLSKAELRFARLERADLSHANLMAADVSLTNLREATLEGADLTVTFMRGAILRNANLSHAKLVLANLNDSDLCGADLSGADLERASLVGAKLEDADLSHVLLDGAKFGDSDLSRVKNLETVAHEGPSTIGIDTIYLSQGKIPEAFLRGAGIPEPFIANMQALVAAMEPIQFYSCFISYSSKDGEFAEWLHADLQSKNVRCWFDREDMKIGDRIRPRIDEAIRVHDKFLLVLTENSIKSPWVEKEVETAFEKERKQGRTVLFPIRLDDAVMGAEEAWAADIRRTRHIGDFCGWKEHDKYRVAFERLMLDLRAADHPRTN